MTEPTKKKKRAAVPDKKKPWYKNWLKERNRARRLRYQTDEGVRQNVIERSRQAYRDKVGLVLTDCRNNLNRLDEIGTVRVVHSSRAPKSMLTFTATEMAEALMVSVLSIYRWRKSGIFPEPAYRMHYHPRTPVYGEKEARMFIKIMGDHQSKVAQYSKRHADTCAALHVAALKVKGVK